MNQSPTENRPLHKMFMDVPPSYDFLNHLLTFRFDEFWRKRAAIECLKNKPVKVLDLCCGTGDLVLRIREMAMTQTQVMALDYSVHMLNLAKKKANKRKLTGIEFFHSDAASMPFPNDHFDSVGIAFAFRNLSFHNPDRDKFIAEILRVLKPGGRFVIIETSQPENLVIRRLFHWYLRWITAPLGGWLSGYYGAYKYLAYSARNYYNNNELKELLSLAGFYEVESRTFLAGIANLYVATKLEGFIKRN
jgi:demethylmenaquinone methyltransferase / 2-methoxy-6-polyprenyl-1,4-benzoquinol methylase